MRKAKKTRLAGLAASFIRAMLILLALVMLGGGALYLTSDPMAYMDIAAFCALLLAGVLTGFINARLGDGGMSGAILPTLSVAVIMVSISLVANGRLVPAIFLDYLSYIGLSFIGGVIAVRLPVRRKRR